VQDHLAKVNEQNKKMADSAAGEGREGGYNGFGVKDDVVEYKLMSGHLFDRLITQYILSGRDIEEDVEGEGEGGGEGGSNSDYESVNITGMGMGTDRGGRGGMGGRGGSGPYMSRDYPIIDSSSTSTGTIGSGSPSGRVAAVDVGTARVSVLYMLVALNMALRTGAEERIETLFKTAQHLSAGRNDPHNPGSSGDTDSIGFPHSESQGTETGTGMGAGVRSGDGVNEGYSVQNSVEMAEGIEEEGEKEGESEGSKIGGKALGKSRVALKKIGKAEEVEKEAEKEEYVDLAVVNEVVQHLMNSWQVR
jgi:hypothetical protein